MEAVDFIKETNRIENIHRDPTKAEIKEFNRFVKLEKVTIEELERFISVYQPNAKLRNEIGMDVMVGRYIPPRGGPHIPEQLRALLNSIEHGTISAYQAHLHYE